MSPVGSRGKIPDKGVKPCPTSDKMPSLKWSAYAFELHILPHFSNCFRDTSPIQQPPPVNINKVLHFIVGKSWTTKHIAQIPLAKTRHVTIKPHSLRVAIIDGISSKQQNKHLVISDSFTILATALR